MILTTASILDYPRPSLAPEIWVFDGESYSLREELKPLILAHLYGALFGFGIASSFSGVSSCIQDILIVGSITSNQYNGNTDVDVHVVLRDDCSWDLDQLNGPVRKYLNVRNQIYVPDSTHPIEYYFEEPKPIDQSPDGVYSLLSEQWLVPPRMKPLDEFPFENEEVAKYITEFGKYSVENLSPKITEIRHTYMDLKSILNAYDEVVLSAGRMDLQEKYFSSIRGMFASLISSILDYFSHIQKVIDDRHQSVYSPTGRANVIFKLSQFYGYISLAKRLYRAISDFIDASDDSIRDISDPYMSSKALVSSMENLMSPSSR